MLNFISSDTTTVLAMQVVFGISVYYVSFVYCNNIKLFRVYSLLVSLIPMFWSLYFYYLYDCSGQYYQLVCYLSRLHLTFAIDGIGLSLIILTSFLFPICIILMRTYSGILTFLLLEITIFGSLTVLDILGFYIMFESSLILLFLLIARTPYGSIDAAYKIVLYTMAGSLILLPVIFLLYSEHGSTNLLNLIFSQECYNNPSNIRQTIFGFGLFFVFAVKIPLIPIHLWLPEAHVAAPTAGSVLLAGVLLKLGGLGFIRYMIPILPNFTIWIFPLISTMCLCSFIFSTLSTIRQVDLKKIVAYSSIAHMSLVTFTIFSISEFSSYASTFMMIAHGLVSPGMFLLVGILYERTHTKFLLYFRGLGNHMPLFSIAFFIFTCANIAFPLSPNFIAEVICLFSLFAVHELYAFIFCLAQVLGAVYAFWAFNRIIHGVNVGQHLSAKLKKRNNNIRNSLRHSNNPGSFPQISGSDVIDLTRLEVALLMPIFICVIWLGIKPVV